MNNTDILPLTVRYTGAGASSLLSRICCVILERLSLKRGTRNGGMGNDEMGNRVMRTGNG